MYGGFEIQQYLALLLSVDVFGKADGLQGGFDVFGIGLVMQ